MVVKRVRRGLNILPVVQQPQLASLKVKAKTKGYKAGGKMKTKGYKAGGKMKKGYRLGGKMMPKGYSIGGKVRIF